MEMGGHLHGTWMLTTGSALDSIDWEFLEASSRGCDHYPAEPSPCASLEDGVELLKVPSF